MIEKLKHHLDRIDSYNSELGIFLKMKSSELDFFFRRSKEWQEGYLDNENFIQEIKDELKRKGLSSKHENVLVDFGVNGFLSNIRNEIESNLFQEDYIVSERTLDKKYHLKEVIESLPEKKNNLRESDFEMWLLTYFLQILSITKVCEIITDDEIPANLIHEWCVIWDYSSASPFKAQDLKKNINPLQSFYDRDNKKWKFNLIKFSQFSIEANIKTLKNSL